MLLKIYVYGYLNRIQSSRRLELEAQRNVELMWLTYRLTPDFKTIARFRANNGKASRLTALQRGCAKNAKSLVAPPRRPSSDSQDGHMRAYESNFLSIGESHLGYKHSLATHSAALKGHCALIACISDSVPSIFITRFRL